MKKVIITIYSAIEFDEERVRPEAEFELFNNRYCKTQTSIKMKNKAPAAKLVRL